MRNWPEENGFRLQELADPRDGMNFGPVMAWVLGIVAIHAIDFDFMARAAIIRSTLLWQVLPQENNLSFAFSSPVENCLLWSATAPQWIAFQYRASA